MEDVETLSKYTERFSLISLRYLNIASATSDGAESQKFSINLSHNTKVVKAIFSNFVSFLFNNANHSEN